MKESKVGYYTDNLSPEKQLSIEREDIRQPTWGPFLRQAHDRPSGCAQ